MALLTTTLALAGLSAPAQAAGTVSGRVTLADGTTAVPGTTVVAQRPSDGTTLASDTTGPDGRYSLTVAEASVDLVVTPPAGSGYGVVGVRDVDTSSGATVDVTLAAADSVTWSGVLRDGTGTPLPDTQLALISTTNVTTTVLTDDQGRYDISVAPGAHRIYLNRCCPTNALSLDMHTDDFNLTTDRTDDLVIPTHTVHIRVVGPSGNPIPNSTIRLHDIPAASSTQINGIALRQNAFHGHHATTDTNGIATLQLLDTPTTLPGYSIAEISAPVETTLPRTAFSVAGITDDRTLVVSFSRSTVDGVAPTLVCADLPATWSASDVESTCTATDSGTGLRDPADASFTISTSVPAGIETSDATAGPRQVCDLADNCTTAEVGGGKVDRKAPTVAFSVAEGSEVPRHAARTLTFACSDGGSGVATCDSAIPSGSPLATGALGTHVVTVSTTDQVGNQRQQTLTYRVVPAPVDPEPEPEPETPPTPVDDVEDHLGYQRAETFVGLQAGQEATRTLSCPSGYLLTDSSLLLQHVDQGHDYRDVRVLRTERQGTDAITATVRNDTAGQAQLKLFVTCLATRTGSGGTLQFVSPASADVTLPHSGEVMVTCPVGSRGVAPAYDVAGGRVVRAEPVGAEGRQWAFEVDGGAGAGSVSVACLSTRTSATTALAFTTVDGSVGGGSQPASGTLTVPSRWSVVSTGWHASAGALWLGAEPQDRQLVGWAVGGSVGMTALAVRGYTAAVPPVPTPTPAPALPQPSAVAPAASALVGGQLRVTGRGKRVAVRVVCRTGCRGTLVLRAGAGGKRLLGKTRVNLRPGVSTTVRVRIPAHLRRVARSSKAVTVVLNGSRTTAKR